LPASGPSAAGSKKRPKIRGAASLGEHGVPGAVHDDGRVRLLALEDEREDAAHVDQLGRVQPALGIGGRVAGGQQHGVAVAERHLERAGQQVHHLAAGLGAAGLEEAEVARGDLGLGGERELAHPARGAPVADERSEGGGDRRHGRQSTRWPRTFNYVRGKCDG